jgi:lipid A 3-O-deacylase
VPAFQAGYVGSIPIARSNPDLMKEFQVLQMKRIFFITGFCCPSLWVIMCYLAWGGGSLTCRAEDGWEGDIIFLNVDNDACAGTDRHYTHGARAGWLSRDDKLPVIFQRLSCGIPAWGIDVQAQKWGIGAGQELYSPGNLQVYEFIPNDRPYAGWLFANVSLQRRGKSSFGCLALETFKLEAGVIGPSALGEETQDLVHNKKAKGWNNQLHTEPGIVLSYDRQFLFALRDRANFWGCGFIPHAGVNVGNVETYLAAGPMLRFGINLPNEFAAGNTPQRFGGYLFTAFDGRLVLRNIFLDGNTYQNSHSVEKELLVGDIKVGLTFVFKNVELTAAETWRTWEFETQKDFDSFGSAVVTIKF